MLIAFGVVLIAILELAARLPDIVLLPQKMEAAIGEYGAKSMQPQAVTTQIAKTQAETRVADTQAQLNAVQQEKIAADTRVAVLQAALTEATAAKTRAETQLVQVQEALAATQVAKTQAETEVTRLQAAQTQAQTRLAQSQAAQTNVDTASKAVDLATTVAVIGGLAYVGKKAYDAMHPEQATQQPATQQTTAQQETLPTSLNFQAGRKDWHKWYDWAHPLTGDTREGMMYWSAARSRKPQPTCDSANRNITPGFLNGCDTAKKFLAIVDDWRTKSLDYRDGWNQGYKETGDF